MWEETRYVDYGRAQAETETKAREEAESKRKLKPGHVKLELLDIRPFLMGFRALPAESGGELD